MNPFARTELLLGEKAMNDLKKCRIAVFGVGGVGGYVVEALARCGIGTFDLIDNDTVSLTNINRQIIATLDSVGELKVDAFKKRIEKINEEAIVHTYPCFVLSDTIQQFDFTKYDYVIDAVDTVSAKIAIIMKAQEYNIPIISSMGTGNKLDPSKLTITDIYKTDVDPLARVMRRELRKRNVEHLKVVFSKEEPIMVNALSQEELPQGSTRRSIPGSISFVPASAGLLIASEVIKDLVEKK